MANKISVTILTKNSEKYINECLRALIRFDEVIVLDNGSTDATIDIIQGFTKVKIFKNEFIGFGPLKNLAISKTNNNWVLSVDSDEIFTPELVNEILNFDLNESNIYSIKRDNYYNHELIQCCGWNNDWVNRLFNKNVTQFNNNQVHESLKTERLVVKKLQNTFKHYSYANASELLQRMDYYSTLWAIDKQGKKSTPLLAIIKALFAFMKFYIFKGGIFFGYRGFLISFSNANGVFYKYIKLYELNK